MTARSQPRKLGTGRGSPPIQLDDPLTVEEARVLAAAVGFLPAAPVVSDRLRAMGESGRAKLNAAISAAREGTPESPLERSIQETAGRSRAPKDPEEQTS